MSITNGIVSSKNYDTRDNLNFEIVHFLFLAGLGCHLFQGSGNVVVDSLCNVPPNVSRSSVFWFWFLFCYAIK